MTVRNIDYICGAGLIFGFALLLFFIRLMNTNVSEDGVLEAPKWVEKLIESTGGVLVRSLLSMLLWVSLCSIIGIAVWTLLQKGC